MNKYEIVATFFQGIMRYNTNKKNTRVLLQWTKND